MTIRLAPKKGLIMAMTAQPVSAGTLEVLELLLDPGLLKRNSNPKPQKRDLATALNLKPLAPTSQGFGALRKTASRNEEVQTLGLVTSPYCISLLGMVPEYRSKRVKTSRWVRGGRDSVESLHSSFSKPSNPKGEGGL